MSERVVSGYFVQRNRKGNPDGETNRRVFGSNAGESHIRWLLTLR